MPIAKMTSKGQVTIPKEVREALHVGKGDRLEFRVKEGGGVEILPKKKSIMALKGILKSKIRGVTIEMMNEAIRRGGTRL